ncbi:hypothetical protein [Mycolicibacterium sp.]|uniref:hypothetical protein n=1 Tax=Mycolicibacterium sp. TaxID=2320850 RepID=UPI00355E7B5B
MTEVEKHLRDALAAAYLASEQLTGARRTRTVQLMDQIENCLAWAQRIGFYIEADQKAVTR